MIRSKCFALAAGLLGAALTVTSYAALPALPLNKPIWLGTVHHSPYSLPLSRLKYSTSGNWSGYAVPYYKSSAQDTFTYVQAAWQVPAVTGGKSALYSSAWIGLDGYNDGSVEQTGTEQDWDPVAKAQSNYSWVELYPNYGFYLGVPVNAGDIVWASVQYLGVLPHTAGTPEYVFYINFTNLSQDVNIQGTVSMPIPPGLSSAEWIMEAPFFRNILPLANFGTAYFVDCQATGVGTYSTNHGGAGLMEPIDFWPVDPLTMQDPEGGKSTPSGLTDQLENDGSTSSGFDVMYSAK